MSTASDIMLYDRHGNAAAVFEAKHKSGTTAAWAARYRRNLVAHGLVPAATYFLLATPDRLYLWRPSEDAARESSPHYVLEAVPVLGPYVERANLDLSALGGQAFELLVGAWLMDLARSPDESVPPEIAESGLLTALKEGRLEFEAAA